MGLLYTHCLRAFVLLAFLNMNERGRSMKIKHISSIDESGQVTIPKELRVKQNWQTYAAVEFFIVGDTIVMRLVNPGINKACTGTILQHIEF